ncbi:hypothetical protein F4775DRAFT_410757 [Biscogniauxia sp. FL1348]|nr:hypothetical protein F4775DRAFT_410757 [Biscogniauxia sp. FL1348]
MSDATNGPSESPAASKASAPKDRNCPYCGQAFTSSSLGRHLDLYIKDKNPKPPDGVHDVDAIRKMRGTITRRQPRGSLARRDTSNPGTPTTSGRRSPPPDLGIRPPAIPKEGQFVVDQTPKYPFQAGWEVTGVINDLPSRNGDMRGSWEDGAGQDASVRPGLQRAPGRVAQKAQLDARQKLADAMDTARAAELALREMLSSWRAAKQNIDMNSVPFDFDPLSLDFPALTLQCLQAPPTLFSSTPHPTSTSWSIQPPSQKQFEALQTYFQEEFRKWRVTCAMATTASSEELTYPPSNPHFPRDVREGVKKAEKAAASLEKQINEHLQSTYQVWEQLPQARRSELWILELARSVGRRQKDIEKFKGIQHTMKQENANLKTQIEHLNRLQQPREFRIVPPATLPIEESLLSYLLDMGAKGHQGIGLNTEDRHVDLNTLVSRAIDRWKTVIISSRGQGMTSQRPLDQPTPTPTPTSAATPNPPPQMKPIPPQQQQQQQQQQQSQQQPQPQQPPPPQQQQQQQQQQPQPQQRSLPTATNPPPPESQTTSNNTPAATSTADEDNSDQDADAEMEEDDGFTPITPVVTKPPTQQQPQLDVPRTRAPNQRMPNNADPRFVMNGAAGNRALNMRQSMPNMNAATTMPGHGHNQQGHLNTTDYGTVVQGVGGDPMYMD